MCVVPCAVRWALTCGLTHPRGHASREGDGPNTSKSSEKGPPHPLDTSTGVVLRQIVWNVAIQHDGILSAHDAAVVLGYHNKQLGGVPTQTHSGKRKPS
jgi:hypothetical protein